MLKTATKKGFLTLLVSIFLFTLSSPVQASLGQGIRIEEIETEGADVIVNEDIVLARNNAIKDSLRKAVEIAVGEFLSSDVVARSFEIINNGIYAEAQHYIQNYRIIEEKADENLYKVRIKAAVSTGSVKSDLKALGLLTMEELQKEMTATVMVSMTVTGIGSYADYVMLRGALEDAIKGVGNLYQRRLESGMAKLAIEIDGGVEILAGRISKKDFKYFSLDIIDSTENSIDVNMVK